MDGSIKHYPRIAVFLGFDMNLDFIDIEQWANDCLKIRTSTDDCCG